MKTSLYILITVVVVAAIAAVFYSTRDTPYTENDGDQTEDGGNERVSSLAGYFEERITALGALDIGQPIEGFDANLLILAFPGLVPSDFEGVETLEGHYVIENDEIVFERDRMQPISSAERAISREGYGTLFANVSERLGISAVNEGDVDRLIEAINTGEQIETRIDEGASALGVKVIPHEVLEDSRCPIDVTCIQAGTVRVRATLESGLGTADQVFELSQPITTEAEEVTLVQVGPNREEGETIEDGEYVFYFRIEKR